MADPEVVKSETQQDPKMVIKEPLLTIGFNEDGQAIALTNLGSLHAHGLLQLFANIYLERVNFNKPTEQSKGRIAVVPGLPAAMKNGRVH